MTDPPVLVGREHEQALLTTHIAVALAGHGSLVLIGGEAGIGKTALAEAVVQAAMAGGALVLIGRCYDLIETPPYGPWVEICEQLSAEQGRTRLPEPLGSGSAPASQAVLFSRLYDLLAELATEQPLVLLLDDFHWADPASLDLLRDLARRVATLPLLLLTAYRADELVRGHPLARLLPTLVREAHAARLDLRRLDDAAVGALVAGRYRLTPSDAKRLRGYLGTRAEGNPLYVGELLRTLEEEKVLVPVEDGWELGDLDAVRVPTLLRQVIEGRLARLGAEAERLLAVAAVIGQEVPLDLWATVGEAGEEALLSVVERAVAARVLTETRDGSAVRFAHALIREALYEGLLAIRRRAWHRRVADNLVAGSQPDAEAVAFHLQQAGDPRAAEWLVTTGHAAQRAYAWLTAAERYEAALALMEARGGDERERGWLLYHLAHMRRLVDARRGLVNLDAAARMAVLAGDRALAASVQVERGWLQMYLGETRQGVATLESGAAAIDALPPEERVRLNRLETLDADATSLNRHWGALVLHRAWTGPFHEAVALGERFVASTPAPSIAAGFPNAMARALGDAYLGMGIAYAELGCPAASRRAFAEARAANQAIGDHYDLGCIAELELRRVTLSYWPERLAERRRLAAEVEEEFGQAGGVGATVPRLFRVPLLVLEGAWAEARALTVEGSVTANLEGGRRGAMAWLGVLAREQGEPELAWAQVRRVLPEGPEAAPAEHPIEELRLVLLAATLALDAGNLPTARAWLECADRWLAWGGAVLGRAERELGWSAYHRALGDLAPARQRTEQALAQGSDPRQLLALLAAHRLLGELDTAAGRHADAAGHLDEALALGEACAAPFERALTLLAFAELRAATGKTAEAQALLTDVRAICEPLGARRALDGADALAARLAKQASAAYPAGLTAREVDVLRLVAAGLSDAEVAERLFLSLHTVKTHLRSIYNKLDVPSRTAAARFATDHGIA